MNVTLAENLFLSNLNFIELDSLSVPSAKDRFHEFQRGLKTSTLKSKTKSSSSS